MKPRNRFEKAVAASNGKLTALSPKAVEWAARNVIVHIAFRTSSHNCTCGDCGAKFDHKGKGKTVCCPHCGHRLQVSDTLKRKEVQSAYFSSLEVAEGIQVQRVFLLRAVCRKGMKLETSCMEVCRLWLNAEGKMAVTSRARTLGWYVDSFNWCTGIDLKILSEVHWVISDTYVYPRYKVLPELRLPSSISVPKTLKPHMTVGWTKGTRRRRNAEVWNRWQRPRRERLIFIGKSHAISGLSSATTTLKYPYLTLWRRSMPREAAFTIACSNASITPRRTALFCRHATVWATASRPWSSR